MRFTFLADEIFFVCPLAPDLVPAPIAVKETTHQGIFRTIGGTLVVSVATGDPSITIAAGVAVIIHVATTEEEEEVVVAAAAVVAAAVTVIVPTTVTEATVTSSNPTSTTAPKGAALAPAHPASAPGVEAGPIFPANPLPGRVILAHLRDPRLHDTTTLEKLPLKIQRVRAHQMKEKATAKKQRPSLLHPFPRSHRASGRA